MIKIYHNPRCRKSREGLAILETHKVDFEIVPYLDQPPSEKELKEIIKKLGISPIDLVRTKEAIWKENFKGKEMSDTEIIAAMVQFPKLIERPIVIKDQKAVLGRPPEKIEELF
jgi:arsenate reductase